jgi:hypothetical protein
VGSCSVILHHSSLPEWLSEFIRSAETARLRQNTMLSLACDGLIRYKSSIGLKPHTIRNYRTAFAKLQTYFSDDLIFASITRDKLVGFFAGLRETYVSEPDGVQVGQAVAEVARPQVVAGRHLAPELRLASLETA